MGDNLPEFQLETDEEQTLSSTDMVSRQAPGRGNNISSKHTQAHSRACNMPSFIPHQ